MGWREVRFIAYGWWRGPFTQQTVNFLFLGLWLKAADYFRTFFYLLWYFRYEQRGERSRSATKYSSARDYYDSRRRSTEREPGVSVDWKFLIHLIVVLIWNFRWWMTLREMSMKGESSWNPHGWKRSTGSWHNLEWERSRLVSKHGTVPAKSWFSGGEGDGASLWEVLLFPGKKRGRP